jgi:hypothetical protein
MMKDFFYFILSLSALILAAFTLHHDFISLQIPHSDFSRIVLYSMTLLYMICALMALIPWSGVRYAGRGVNVHFRLMFLIGSGLTVPLLIFSLRDHNVAALQIPVACLLLIFYLIGLTLLRYRFRDKDPLAPGYFSEGDYKRG